jgi:hypothetical protein
MASALICIVLYAVYSWTLAPHVDYVLAVHQFGSAVEDIQRETMSLEEELNQDQSHLETLQCQFAEMKTALFAYEEAKDFLGAFESWAEACRCSLATVIMDGHRPVRVLPKVGKEGLIEAMDVEVTVIGSMPQVSLFLRKLQDHPRYLTIESIRLTATHHVDRTMRCRIALRLYVLHG